MKRMGLTGSAVVVAMAVMVSACGKSQGHTGNPGPVPLSYYKDIKPLFDAKCTQCHYEGGIGPFSLEKYDAALPWGPMIKQKVEDKTMPPWPPDNACNDYLGDRSLPEDQIQKIAAWVDGGMIKGNPADEGAPLDTGPNGVVARRPQPFPSVEYTPQSEPDDYRCLSSTGRKPRSSMSPASGRRRASRASCIM
jgi:hypothetical protein